MKKMIGLVFLFISSSLMAGEVTLVSMQYSPSGDFDIVFHNADTSAKYFELHNPETIILDFPATGLSIAQKSILVNQRGIKKIDLLNSGGNTRAVIALDRKSMYQVKRSGQNVVLSFPSLGEASSVQKIKVVPNSNVNSKSKTEQFGIPAKPILLNGNQAVNSSGKLFSTTTYAAAPVVTTSNLPVAITTVKPTIINPGISSAIAEKSAIESAKPSFLLKPQFHKNARSGGSLSFSLPKLNTPVSVEKKGNSVVAIISNYQVPKSEQRRMDVADYATPVKYIDIEQASNRSTKLSLYMGSDGFTVKSYQNGNLYYVDIDKPTSYEKAQAQLLAGTGLGGEQHYSGAPISLNFQDIEVRAVLQIIAEFINQNIVVSDSVRGNITLRLNDVPWDQALQIILKTKGLGERKSGNVIYVAPQIELNNSEIDALASLKKKEELEPLQTELVQLSYAKASDIAKMIQNNGGSGNNNNNSNSSSVLSSRGSVIVDNRTNTLLLSDTPIQLQELRHVINSLDKPVQQVMIDSRLVITSSSFSRDLGAKFGLAFGNKGTWGASGTLDGADGYRSNGASGTTLNNRLGLNLPAATTSGSPGSFGLSILGKDILVGMELQALQAEGITEILSNPKVVTQDGYNAVVSSGQEIPYKSNTNDSNNTQFKDAKLSLDVTPHITPDNRVAMAIHITKDSADYSNPVGGEPPINTNEINTKVDVDNGATVVLGGIFQQVQSTSTKKVPLLGDIPIVGNLFKSTSKSNKKDELLIFITPSVLDPSMTSTTDFSDLRQ